MPKSSADLVDRETGKIREFHQSAASWSSAASFASASSSANRSSSVETQISAIDFDVHPFPSAAVLQATLCRGHCRRESAASPRRRPRRNARELFQC